MINICLEGDMFAHISFDNGERQAEMYRLDSDLGVAGDVNRDGELNISDLVFLQRWLINKDKNELPDRRLADVNYDGDVDVFDLIALKKLIIGKLL
ncbi:dockerin type I repeat-containing protein [Ruminococcus sp.]|nr:dockerin type I repeat-containing protein [Ruminococcus sp.]HNZ99798.1 dockerin type I repeat-containing protein [Ruminococcus sp.]HOH85842.1 dockerin type I repeat-containing protein [Ruminococcus sp.]